MLEQGQSSRWRATRPSFARLLEGNSIRSTERITGLHRDTILRLLVLAGERCEKFLGKALVNVPVTDGQCDEIWGYVFKKEAHKTPLEAHNKGIGDAYCFVAIKRNTNARSELHTGARDQISTDTFIEGLRNTSHREIGKFVYPSASEFTNKRCDDCEP